MFQTYCFDIETHRNLHLSETNFYRNKILIPILHSLSLGARFSLILPHFFSHFKDGWREVKKFNLLNDWCSSKIRRERERKKEEEGEKGRYELPLFLSLQTFGRSLFSSSNFFTTICWWKSYVAVLFSSWHFLSWFSPSLFFLLSLSPDVFDSFTTLSSFLFSSLSCCCCWDEKNCFQRKFH